MLTRAGRRMCASDLPPSAITRLFSFARARGAPSPSGAPCSTALPRAAAAARSRRTSTRTKRSAIDPGRRPADHAGKAMLRVPLDPDYRGHG